ncbi:MAG: Asp-tRNA(Asn)/Glu-tRNA(Gln) amidotransferase subunit GatA [Trueperaceae bacterium]|nr:Asp-tRNA(Asn)/Glu-tRNA(Gln) amidotransferase subunit GatA [Trueperaceae bacterium]
MASARETAAAVRSGRVTAVELAEGALAAAASSTSNAFVALAEERALARAAAVDAQVAAGRDPGPLAGVPVAVKDNICTAGVATTAGSAVLRGFVPPYDATVVARLEAAGALVIGKTNLDEFGMGSSSETSVFGPVRHPADPHRVAGGSSGGSAVAVAEGVVPLALGTDTGGSVRQPAAFCGVFGIKPTYGRLSRHGVIAYASSLDQVGVFSRDPDDAAVALSAMAGRDPADATTAARPADEVGPVPVDLRGLRVGRIADLWRGVSDGVRAALDGVAARFAEAGATVVDVELPIVEAAVASYYLIAMAEASSNLSRYDGTLYGLRVGEARDGHEAVARATRAAGLGREVQRRVLMGSFALSAGYADAYAERAARVRRRIADALQGALAGVDVLLAPTAPTVAWRQGERLDDPLAMYVADVTTCLANLSGMPALSLPAGAAEDGLPAGAQLIGPAWSEARLLGWARAVTASA